MNFSRSLLSTVPLTPNAQNHEQSPWQIVIIYVLLSSKDASRQCSWLVKSRSYLIHGQNFRAVRRLWNILPPCSRETVSLRVCCCMEEALTDYLLSFLTSTMQACWCGIIHPNVGVICCFCFSFPGTGGRQIKRKADEGSETVIRCSHEWFFQETQIILFPELYWCKG